MLWAEEAAYLPPHSFMDIYELIPPKIFQVGVTPSWGWFRQPTSHDCVIWHTKAGSSDPELHSTEEGWGSPEDQPGLSTHLCHRSTPPRCRCQQDPPNKHKSPFQNHPDTRPPHLQQVEQRTDLLVASVVSGVSDGRVAVLPMPRLGFSVCLSKCEAHCL